MGGNAFSKCGCMCRDEPVVRQPPRSTSGGPSDQSKSPTSKSTTPRSVTPRSTPITPIVFNAPLSQGDLSAFADEPDSSSSSLSPDGADMPHRVSRSGDEDDEEDDDKDGKEESAAAVPPQRNSTLTSPIDARAPNGRWSEAANVALDGPATAGGDPAVVVSFAHAREVLEQQQRQEQQDQTRKQQQEEDEQARRASWSAIYHPGATFSGLGKEKSDRSIDGESDDGGVVPCRREDSLSSDGHSKGGSGGSISRGSDGCVTPMLHTPLLGDLVDGEKSSSGSSAASKKKEGNKDFDPRKAQSDFDFDLLGGKRNSGGSGKSWCTDGGHEDQGDCFSDDE